MLFHILRKFSKGVIDVGHIAVSILAGLLTLKGVCLACLIYFFKGLILSRDLSIA